MSLLLPVLVAIPPVLAFVFETPLLEQLHALVQPRNDGSLHPIGRWARRTNLSATARLDRLLGTKSLDGSLTEDSYISQTRDSRRSSGDLDVARNTLHRAGSSGRAGFSGVSRATDPSSMGTQSVDTPVQEPATDAPHSVNDETSLIATFAVGPLGVGLSTQSDGKVVVTSIEDGSAAEKQGVRVNSAVLEVSGESRSGLDKEGVLVMIRSTARPLTLKLAPSTAEIRRQPATGKSSVRDAPGSVEDKSSVRMEEEIELELKQLRGQRGGGVVSQCDRTPWADD